MLRPMLKSHGTHQRESLSVQLTRALGKAIATGRLKAGDRLPSEQELCGTYGVSRTVVREAISSLKAEGLIASYQGKGAFVLERPVAAVFRIDSSELAAAQEVVKVLDLRIGVEAEAAAIAATVRTSTALRELRQARRAMDGAIDAGSDAVEEDLAFHRALMAATGNRYFLDFFNYLGSIVIPRTRVDRFKSAPEQRVEYLRMVNREHEAILLAVERGDAEAARMAVRVHLGRSRDALRASLRR